MMQSCASAAKLRGGGPILENGATPWPVSGDRPLGSSAETGAILFARLQERVLSAFSFHAGRKTTSAGTSPVDQIKEVEEARAQELERAPPDKPQVMVRLLARVIGIGLETSDMLVQEVLARTWRDR